jgi:hypothetical protein
MNINMCNNILFPMLGNMPHVCTRTDKHASMCTHAQTNMTACKHTQTHVPACAHTHTHTHRQTSQHVHTQTNMPACAHTHRQTCQHVCTRTDKHHTACLETCRAPFNKLNCFLLLNHGYGWVHILGHYITTVQHADCHVLPSAWITVHLPTHSNCKTKQDTICLLLQSPLKLTQQLCLQ